MRPSRTARGSVGVFALIVIAAAACGPPSGSGDPGNKRLNQLSADPIFAALPDGAQLSGTIEKTPAKFQDNGWFEPSGWSGPAVRITLVASGPPDAVLAFYADLARTSGWIGNGNKKDGYPVDWTKKFPGGWQGGLGLIDMSSRSVTPGQPHTFVLNASAPAV